MDKVNDVHPCPSASDRGPQNHNLFVRLIQYHYGNTKNAKSLAQLSREAYLLPGVAFNRWFCMPAAIIIQFCVGSLYAWSVFNKPIDLLIYNEVANMAPITFYIATGCLGISAALFGPWLERNGPMVSSLLGTSLFFAGNLLTALSLYFRTIWLVFVGYGIIGGFGIGLCYISPVSALQKWFPDRRGLASGVAVCGFGAGSIVMAKVQIPLITALGLPLTFVALGSVYFVCMSLSGLVLRTPPPGYGISGGGIKPDVVAAEAEEVNIEMGNGSIKEFKQHCSDDLKPSVTTYSLMEALTSTDFRLMYVMFLANTLFGLVVISRLSNLVTDVFDQSAEVASTIVAINGGFNLAGRLFFSIISDYVGRKHCYVVMLTCQLIIVGCFPLITSLKTYWAFLMTMWVLTACYGGGFATIPAFLSDTFGSNNIGACHGVALTQWSVSGVVGGLIYTGVFNYAIYSGYTVKDSYPYNVNVWWLFPVVLIGWIAVLFVSPTFTDRDLSLKVRSFLPRMFSRGRVTDYDSTQTK